MRYHSYILTCLLTLSVTVLFSQVGGTNYIGVNVDTPSVDLDIRALNTTDGSEINIGNFDNSYFVRLFSGRTVFPFPYLYWKQNTPFSFATAEQDGSNFVERMRISPSGSLGIGTSQPLAKLDIAVQGDGAEILRLSTERPWVFKQTNSSFLSRLTLQPTSNDKWFEVLSQNGLNRAVEFYSNNVYSRVMLVPDGGEVGIGVDDANAKLQVSHNSTPSFPLILLTEQGDDFARLRFNNTVNAGAHWTIAAHADTNTAASQFNFFFSNSTNSGDRLTIKGDGKVGVGTTNPVARLHVAGDFRVDGLSGNGDRNVIVDGNGRFKIGTLGAGDSDWTQNASYVYNNTHEIGIGTATPYFSKLHIVNDIDLANDGLFVQNFVDDRIAIVAQSVGVGRGLWASTEDGIAVSGLALSNTGQNTGIFGSTDSPDGYAGRFSGRVHVQGDMTVSGTLAVSTILLGDFANLQYDIITNKLYYDNSSLRFKENIVDLKADFGAILQARPVKYTRPGTPDRFEIGYIAEEMAALGLDALIGYDANGLVENFNYEKMILYVVEVLKSQQTTQDVLQRDFDKQMQRISDQNQELLKQLTMQQDIIDQLQAAVKAIGSHK